MGFNLVFKGLNLSEARRVQGSYLERKDKGKGKALQLGGWARG